ncbi:hypothetical protein PanWU01x14_198740 [Parasponia andersonii]|uniref:Uncharacterized protein n=1 Tax=Parasponia andersonii TaxID=3476 RepID=A0A2P5BZ07_PARAD|nr:hypothetical protein PanWU01x14_198740 [Parasponia andersonii]
MEFNTDYFPSTMLDELLLSVCSHYEIPDDIHLLSPGEGDVPDLPDPVEPKWKAGLVQASRLAKHHLANA